MLFLKVYILRNAVKIIEKLIADADTPVKEIINRIMNVEEVNTPTSTRVPRLRRYDTSSSPEREFSTTQSSNYYEEKSPGSTFASTESEKKTDSPADEALPTDLQKVPLKRPHSSRKLSMGTSAKESSNKHPVESALLSEALSKLADESPLEKEFDSFSTSLASLDIHDMKGMGTSTPIRNQLSPNVTKFVSAWQLSTTAELKPDPPTSAIFPPNFVDGDEELRRKAPGYRRPSKKPTQMVEQRNPYKDRLDA